MFQAVVMLFSKSYISTHYWPSSGANRNVKEFPEVPQVVFQFFEQVKCTIIAPLMNAGKDKKGGTEYNLKEMNKGKLRLSYKFRSYCRYL